MNRRPAIASVLVAAVVLAGCSKKTADTTPAADTTPVAAADLIITGGPIVTMEGDQPATAEAIVVDDGRITFVGSKADALKQQADGTVVKDLGGKTLMPGFIDGHAHAQQFGTQAVGANLLAPPDGTVNTIDDLVDRLKAFAAGPDVGLTGWIIGVGYDDALLGRHPTREDLDKVSTTVPVMATHISAHFAAVNTLGLKLIGYDASTPNPEGGVIRREADGKTPNGVLEELAAMPYMVKFLTPTTQAGKDIFLKRGLEMAKSYGYTTTNEGRMFGTMHADMANAAARGLVDIDFNGWMDYSNRAELDRSFATAYTNHYRLAGLKITLDGSPQGRTAWRTVPYLLPPDGQQPGYKGYPAIPDTKQVEAYLDEAYTKGWPVKVHANGDAAIDQLFEALKPVVAKHGVKPGQVTLIHGQFIRPDQVQAAEVARHLPVDVPDAHVLLGRLVQADRRPGTGGADLADALDPEHRPARDQPHRRAGCASQPDAGRVGHGESHLALRGGHRPRRARHPLRSDEDDHPLGRRAVRRAGDQGLHQGGQARRPRRALRQPAHRGPGEDQPDPGPRNDQGRQDGLGPRVRVLLDPSLLGDGALPGNIARSMRSALGTRWLALAARKMERVMGIEPK